MSYEVIFTPEAEDTYESIVAQLSERWGEKFVLEFENNLDEVLENLEKSPFMYPVYEEAIQIRRVVLHKNCSLLYKVISEVVLVVCFWDNRQDSAFYL